MSSLISLKNDVASVASDNWTLVKLPESQVEERKQAGKVVLFKLTGEQTVTEAQVANTVIPETGNVIVPLSVFIARQQALKTRIAQGEIGVWLATHELLDNPHTSTDRFK